MFIESQLHAKRTGWIEIITGSMFSGKTEELMRRLRRAQIANLKIEIFKPEIENRYDEQDIVSHDEKSVHSTPVSSAGNIMLLANEVDVVGIDEAQFFDSGLISTCQDLANAGTRVIVAGLDMDFKGKPFGPVPGLMAVAEYVTKVHAICARCGNLAHFSHRKTSSDKLFLLGEADHYEPLCRSCFIKVNELKSK